MNHQSPFADPTFAADPYGLYARLRESAPVEKTVLPSGIEVYLVSRYADVQAGLKDRRLVKDIRNARSPEALDALGMASFGSNMLRADPPDHTRLRKLASEAFKPKYISQMRGHIERIADRLLDRVQAAGAMDVIAEYALPLPITVISEMLGVPAADHERFSAWSNALLASGTLSNESFAIGPELAQLAMYVRELVADHRERPRDDLISQLIEAEHDGERLNELELISTVILLLIAGHETTVNLIGNGMLALLQNPDQLELLKREPARTAAAVEELLRYVNPVHLVNRYAAEDIEIAGVAIPRGSHLQLMVAAANHDPAYLADAGKLDLTRDEARHVAFGQGIHYCLGAPLARLEGEIAFAALLRRLPNVRLAIAPEALEWRPALELRGLKALPVVF